MAVHLITATFDHISGLSEDRMVNTFHFEGDSTIAIVGNAFDMVEDFYTTDPTGLGISVSDRLSSGLAGTWTLRAYNLEDAPPRVPVDERAGTAFTPGTGRLPSEVSVVLSFQAVPQSGIPQARRRNRIYVGPLSETGVLGSNGRPSAGIIDVLAGAARDMKQASDASINMNWVVYSPTIAGPESTGNPPPNVAGAFALVNNGWVDDAFDTQRRRGLAPTARTLFTATTP